MSQDSPVSPLSIRRLRAPAGLPVVLGCVAGYVDACTFLGLFGLFVAQVTGSFALTGTQLVTGGSLEAAQVLAIPVFFAGGVVATLTATVAQALRGPALPAVLLLELALLTGFAGLGLWGMPLTGPQAALTPSMLAIAAMGVQSALARLLLEDCPSTNVMTTNTTQLAIDATQSLLSLVTPRARRANAARFAAVRHRLVVGLRVILGFFAGVVVGGLVYLQIGLIALILPIAALAWVTAWACMRAQAWAMAA